MDWIEREMARFASGHYQQIPWLKDERLEEIPFHFAHVSKNQPGMIAYTETPEKGIRDIQTVQKPGRYLKRFYPDLSPTEIKDLSREIGINAELFFAVTADEIEDVYTNGPDSCMAGDASGFESYEHPVRVYGNSDLQVAYLKRGHRITARALVWPEKKLVNTAYGDADFLLEVLENKGYTVKKDLSGAKINLIKNSSDEIICPYIDCCGSVGYDKESKKLVIGGDIEATNTNGLACVAICKTCEDITDETSATWVYNKNTLQEEVYCKDCMRSNEDYFFCHGYQEYFPKTNKEYKVLDENNNEVSVCQQFYKETPACEYSGLKFIFMNYLIVKGGNSLKRVPPSIYNELVGSEPSIIEIKSAIERMYGKLRLEN